MIRQAAASAFLLLSALPAAAHDHAAMTDMPDGAPASAAPPIPGLPGLGGSFSLTDQDGRIRTDQEFRGKLLLVTFGYTDCPDVCPLQLQKVSQALDQVTPAVAGRVVPLFISVDPEHDTPDRLRRFVAAFSPAIIGLTGSRQEIGKLVQDYHVHVAAAPAGTSGGLDHSDLQYLMGPDGKFLTLILPNATAADIAARLTKYAART